MRLALAVEDVLQLGLVSLLGLLGRHRVAVLPFLGHGTPERVHVRARVVLGSRSLPAPGEAPPIRAGNTGSAPRVGTAGRGGASAMVAAGTPSVVATGPAGRPAPWRTLRTSLGRFLTVELPRSPVTVRTPGGETTVRCDRQGYVDTVVELAGLPPGWNDVSLTTTWRDKSAAATAHVLVVDPDARLALVSDVDDTVIETGLTRGLEFLRLTLLTEVADRVPLPGAAELYRALTAGRGGPPGPVFYLSTSPWNLHDLLTDFITLRGFPSGPLLLTDWGPGRGAFLRIPAEEHKLTLIRQVLADHPALRVVLVGDTGQVDPEIYATVAGQAPDRVAAAYVRRAPGISAARAAEVDALAREVTAAGVPMLAVDDSVQIAEHAASIGLLDPAAVRAVRRASGG